VGGVYAERSPLEKRYGERWGCPTIRMFQEKVGPPCFCAAVSDVSAQTFQLPSHPVTIEDLSVDPITDSQRLAVGADDPAELEMDRGNVLRVVAYDRPGAHLAIELKRVMSQARSEQALAYPGEVHVFLASGG
jgi:hypothetical protein